MDFSKRTLGDWKAWMVNTAAEIRKNWKPADERGPHWSGDDMSKAWPKDQPVWVTFDYQHNLVVVRLHLDWRRLFWIDTPLDLDLAASECHHRCLPGSGPRV